MTDTKGVHSMANDENLRTPTTKEAREIGRKGGIASGIAKRRKKLMRESLEILCQLPAKGGRATDVESIKNFAELKGKNITVEQAMLIAQIKKALGGDTRAIEFIRDTMGQKPVEEKKVETNVNQTNLLADIVGQMNSDE